MGGGGGHGEGAGSTHVGPLSAGWMLVMFVGMLIAPWKWPVMFRKAVIIAFGLSLLFALFSLNPRSSAVAPFLLLVAWSLRKEK